MANQTIEQIQIEVAANVAQATKSLEQLNKKLDRLGTTTKNVTKFGKAAKSSAASVKIMKNANGLATSSFIRMSAKIGVTVMALSGLATALGKAITASNEYIENMNLFRVSMGSAAESAENYANTVSEALGIDSGVWMRYQGVFNTIITGFGVATDKANIMSQQLTQLGYDISSFFNISVEDAMLKIQSGISGELEPLRRIGYDLSVARLQQEAYRLGIDKAVTSMTQAEKAQLRYYAIMTQVSASHTDMARTIESPANQLRVLQAQITMTARAIGNLFIPILNKVLPYVIAFTKVVRKAAEAVAELLGITLSTVDYSDVSSGLSTITDDVTDIGDESEETEEKVKELKKTLLGFDEINRLNDNSALDDLDDSLDDSDSGSFNVPIPTYDFLEGYLGSKADEIADRMIEKIKELVNWVKNLDGGFVNLKEAVGNFKKGWDAAFDPSGLVSIKNSMIGIKDSLMDIFSDSGVRSAAQNFMNSYMYYLGSLAGSVVTIGSNIGAGIFGGLNRFLNNNKDRIKNDIIEFFNINSDTLNWLSELNIALAKISEVFSGENAQKVSEAIWGLLYNPFELVVGIISRVGNDFVHLIAEPIVANAQEIKDALDAAFGLFGDVLQDLSDLGEYLNKKFFKWWDEDWKPKLDEITEALEDFVNKFCNWLEKHIVPDLEDVYKHAKKVGSKPVVDGITNLGSAIGNLAESIGGLLTGVLLLKLGFFDGWDKNADNGLVTFLDTLTTHFAVVVSIITNTLAIIANFASAVISVLELVSRYLSGGDWHSALDQFNENVDAMASNAGAIGEAISDTVGDYDKTAFAGSGKGMAKEFKSYGNTLGNAGGAIDKLFTDIVNKIGDGLDSIWEKISGWFTDTLFPELSSELTSAADIIKGWFSFDLGVDENGAKEDGYMAKTAYGAWSVLYKKLEEINPELTTKLDDTKSLITTKMGEAAQSVRTTWEDAGNTLKGIWNGIKDTASTVWTNIKTTFSTAIDNIKGMFNFSWKLPDIHFKLPKIEFEWQDTGLGFNIPTNFHLGGWNEYAKGGYFTGATAGIIGEAGDEAVLPLTDKRAMSSIANSIVSAGGMSGPGLESAITRAVQKALGNGLAVNVYSTLQTDDEAIARSASRGNAKLNYRYSPVGE